MFANNKLNFSLLFLIVLSLTSLVAQVAAQPNDPTSYGMTSGRFVASMSALMALIGVIIGALALLRPNGLFGTASGRLGAILALAGGLIGAVVGGLKAATSTGIGTGGGLAGAVIAVALGLVAIALGGLALARSRTA